MPVDKSFDAALTCLKKQGYSIEVANKDGGKIATSMVVTGGWHQTGTRVLVSLIKETDSTTTLRVAVTKQKRYKALQTEPWGDPQVDGKESSEVAEKMRNEFRHSVSN